jgi:hypothetical protein
MKGTAPAAGEAAGAAAGAGGAAVGAAAVGGTEAAPEEAGWPAARGGGAVCAAAEKGWDSKETPRAQASILMVEGHMSNTCAIWLNLAGRVRGPADYPDEDAIPVTTGPRPWARGEGGGRKQGGGLFS